MNTLEHACTLYVPASTHTLAAFKANAVKESAPPACGWPRGHFSDPSGCRPRTYWLSHHQAARWRASNGRAEAARSCFSCEVEASQRRRRRVAARRKHRRSGRPAGQRRVRVETNLPVGARDGREDQPPQLQHQPSLLHARSPAIPHCHWGQSSPADVHSARQDRMARPHGCRAKALPPPPIDPCAASGRAAHRAARTWARATADLPR